MTLNQFIWKPLFLRRVVVSLTMARSRVAARGVKGSEPQIGFKHCELPLSLIRGSSGHDLRVLPSLGTASPAATRLIYWHLFHSGYLLLITITPRQFCFKLFSSSLRVFLTVSVVIRSRSSKPNPLLAKVLSSFPDMVNYIIYYSMSVLGSASKLCVVYHP